MKNEVTADMISAAHQEVADHDAAIVLVRAMFRHFGGRYFYWPATGLHSKSRDMTELRGVLADASNDRVAQALMERWSLRYRNQYVYIPLEHKAFRDEIADDVYKRYVGTTESMAELCREYRVTFTQIYRLCSYGRERRQKRPSTPSLFDESTTGKIN